MKILITGTTGESMPPPYGGVPKLSLLSAREWKKMGHQVALTFTYRPENADDLGAEAEYFFEYKSKPNKVAKILFLFKYFLANPFLYSQLFFSYFGIFSSFSREAVLYSAYGVFLEKVFNSFKPDIVLGEAVLIKTFMAAKVAKRKKIPIIFDSYAEIHDLSMGVNKILDEKKRNKYWKEFLNLADLVIPPGPYCSRGPLSYLPREKVEFVYDGSDYSICELNIKEDKKSLRNLLKLPDAFLVGNVGAFESRKGHDHLIKAISIIKDKGFPVHAVICGGSGDATKWKLLAKEGGVEDRVHFFGRISELELGRVLKSLDVYSDLENTPRACGLNMAILEAMAMGLPVVIYNNKDMLEIVEEGKNGFITPINDIEAFADGLIRMYNLSVDERLQMGEESSMRAKKIDINFTAREKLNLFTKVIKSYK